MVKSLRQYHYLIWRLWAILLPIAFLTAIALRPELPLPNEGDETAFTAILSPDTDSTLVVTVTLGKPIKVASCVAILSSAQKEIVLGTLDRPGRYRFIVPSFDGEGTLNLVDAIHKQRIGTLPLQKK
jgi:hypothetical protein